MARLIFILFFAGTLAGIGFSGVAQVAPTVTERDAQLDAVIESTTTKEGN